MKGTEHFKQTIKEYLDGRAQTDELFAVSYAKENKNLDDCITFILNQVKASGCCGMTDDEVWSLAIHYYDEDNIDVGNPISCGVVVNHKVELTEEEKAQRTKAMQKALIDAIEVPLSIMKACARVIDLSDFMAHNGSKMALSDVATGVSFAKGALKGAALNIFVNAKMLDDRELAKRYTDETECLIIEWGKRADDIYVFVLEGLR